MARALTPVALALALYAGLRTASDPRFDVFEPLIYAALGAYYARRTARFIRARSRAADQHS